MQADECLAGPAGGGNEHLADPSLTLNSPNVPQAVPATDVLPFAMKAHQEVSLDLGKENIVANPATVIIQHNGPHSIPATAPATTPKKEHPEDVIKLVQQTNGPSKDAMSPLHIHSIKQALGNSEKLVSSPCTTSVRPPASLSTASTHPQPPIDPSTFASPIRPTAGTFHLDPSAPSPIPPPSAGKRELNEAAMALTWLAEACTAAQPPSPFQNDAYLCAAFRQKTTPQTAVTDSFLSTEHTRSSGLRGRRAASQRCTTVLREALQSELDFALSPRSVSAPTLNTQHRRAPNGAQRVGSGNQGGARGARRANRAAAGANTGERRSKGYSMNSRVGRAMVSILAFIEENQPRFKAAAALPGSKATSEGVPERIIRTEFGNNPDTSKALRFLVTEHKIVRNGQGGRRDPFSYTIAPANAALYSMAGTEVSAQHLVAAVAKVETSPATDASGAVTGNNPQEEEVDKARCHGGAALPSTATPRLTAAVAALAPSTGKWPQTVSRIAAETAVAVKKAQLQPRLSLGGAGPVFHDDGRVPVGVKRPAPTATPAVVVPAAKRPTATPPSAAASAMMAPGSAKWPSQLPTSQRLSTTSPLQGLSAAAHPAHGTMAFPRGGAATAAGVATFTPTAQVQQTQAALVQLHALQLLYQQQQQWVLAAQKVQEQMKEQQQAQPGQGEFPTATAEELVKLS